MAPMILLSATALIQRKLRTRDTEGFREACQRQMVLTTSRIPMSISFSVGLFGLALNPRPWKRLKHEVVLRLIRQVCC